MATQLRVRLAAVLGAMFALGTVAVATSSTEQHIGFMWPVGLASGALLLSPRRLTSFVAVVVVVLAGLSFGLGGYPLATSAGYAVGVAAEGLVAQQLLTSHWSHRLRLLDLNDLARYALACILAAGVGAVVFAGVSLSTSFGVPWQVGLAAFGTHLASQGVLLGLFKDRLPHGGTFGTAERAAAWVLTVVVSTAAFIPIEAPSLAFLVVPLLGWMAFRAPRDAMLQLVVVAVIASTFTNSGLGPFSDPYFLDRIHPEFAISPSTRS